PGDIIDLYPVKPERTIISVPDISASVERLTGLKVTTDESNKILEALGIHLTEPGSYESPTWRYDLAIEEDLVEEVAR
ncbi:hypothetical protein OFM13_34125, partial [Escherichia coli]|nr:hypothetical protein [Escherichia coli]